MRFRTCRGGMAVVAGPVRALARSHADATLSVLAVSVEVRTIPCGAVHAVAAGKGGVRAKVVSLAPAKGAGRCRRVCRTELLVHLSAVLSGFRVWYVVQAYHAVPSDVQLANRAR